MNIEGNIEERFSDWSSKAVSELKNEKSRQKVARAIALRFAQKVIPRTPVDTGRARGGFTVVPGAGNMARAGSKGGGDRKGREMSEYSEHFKDDPDWRIEIINGVPYVTWLELGSSLQAPAGMVRRTLREMMKPLKAAELRRMEAAFRLANIKARAKHKTLQGMSPRGAGRLSRVRG